MSNENLLCEYQVYTRKKAITYLIVGLVLVSTFGIIQVWSASDSIIEIRIDKDFYFDSNTRIYGFGSAENKTLGELSNETLNFSPFSIFLLKPSSILTTLDYDQREKWFMKQEVFGDLNNDLNENGVMYKSLGFISVNGAFFTPNATYKIRVPRGYILWYCMTNMGNIPNGLMFQYTEISDITSKFYFYTTFTGTLNNTLTEK
jgi:hypothetical protein